MDTQFRKGVLELIILKIGSEKDTYGYELVLEISKFISVNEGIIYPLLRRLTNKLYFETYIADSKNGPNRIYYKITDLGIKRLKELKIMWSGFQKNINKFIKEHPKDE